MEQKRGCGETVARDGSTRWSASGRSVDCVRRGLIGLGLVGALIPAGGAAAQAQEARLTVRPREMATGTQNPAAGAYPLDSVPNTLVSVPPQCVGPRRCPLFIFLPGAGASAEDIAIWLRPVADKYGMILLTTTDYGTDVIDAALKEILQRFAIEPDKIAIIGRCASGASGMVLGTSNLDVFSRVVVISGGVPTNGLDPNNKTVEFFLDAGYLESAGNFQAAQKLRRAGHPVKLGIRLRGHEHQMEDYDFLGRWLQESWAKPDPAARTAPVVVADPLPLLTTEALRQMTTFWTSFSREPDSIRMTARRAHLREVVVPVGEERPSVVMTDMPALAAKYPSVAAALTKAGLTARQHETYRVALISALVANNVGTVAGKVEPASVLAKNAAFVHAHPDEFKVLENAGIEPSDKFWETRPNLLETFREATGLPDPDKSLVFSLMSFTPDHAEALGTMGIWRTP